MDTDSLIKSRYIELPQALQDALVAPETLQAVRQLSLRYGLSPDEHEAFEKEVMIVLLGFEKRAAFKENLARAVNLEQEAVAYIDDELERLVFGRLQGALAKLAASDAALDTQQTAHDSASPPVPTATTTSASRASSFGTGNSVGLSNQQEGGGLSQDAPPPPPAASQASSAQASSIPRPPVPPQQYNTPPAPAASTMSLEESRLVAPTSLAPQSRVTSAPRPEPYRPSGGGDPYREPI